MDTRLSKDEMQAILNEFRQLASTDSTELNSDPRQMDFFDLIQPPTSISEEQEVS